MKREGEMVADWGPDTPEEMDLKAELAGLRKAYNRDAEYIIKRLAEIRAMKIPRMYFVPAPARRNEQGEKP